MMNRFFYANNPFIHNNMSHHKIQNKNNESSISKNDPYTNFDTKTKTKFNHVQSENSTIEENNFNHPILKFQSIEIYEDDLMILMLLFFLYKEDVHDTFLYIALFALLLL